MSSNSPPLSKKPFILRPAEAKDASELATFGAHVWTVTFGHSLSHEDLAAYIEESYTPSSILADISNPAVTLTVAYSPTTSSIIGFSQLRRDSTEPCIEGKPKPVELQRLYVHPKSHGQGVGKRLFDDVERRAREEGYATLWLGVWEENAIAQKVYERFGFGRVGEHEFVMGDCVQIDWILSKEL